MDDFDLDDQRNLFISNIRENSKELLYELFLQAGPIENVSISPAVDNNLIGVVKYKHQSAVPYAKDMFHGVSLFGRYLEISSDNLFDLAKQRVRQARENSLQGYAIHSMDRSEWRMDPRHRSDYRDERNGRYDPYDSHRRRDDRRHDYRHNSSRRDYNDQNRNYRRR